MSFARRGAALAAVLSVAAGLAVRADDPPRKQQSSDDAYITKPTAQHKLLAREVGVWDAVAKTFMPGSSEAQRSEGVETNTMMPGGLWLLSQFKGEFGGMPFEGLGQTGYDPKKGKYVGTWIDSMTARIALLEGTYDSASETFTYLSDGVDPMSGKPTKEKYVSVMKDPNTRVFTMYLKSDDTKGEFVKMMEISYTRRKG